MRVNTMVYFAVDQNGDEWVFDYAPRRRIASATIKGYWDATGEYCCELPTGTIERITDKELSWDDPPYAYVGDNYDPSPDDQPGPM